jgi:hypothetical protein
MRKQSDRTGGRSAGPGLPALCLLVLLLGAWTCSGPSADSPDVQEPGEYEAHGDAVEPAGEPSPSDGKGTASLQEAAPAVAGFPGTWTITYTAAGEGVAVGGGVVLQVSPFWQWSPPQDRFPDYPGYTTVSCSDPGVHLDVATGQHPFIVARVREKPLAAGETISFVYGDTSGGANPRAAAIADRYAEHGENFFIKVDGDGDEYFAPIAKHPSVDVAAGPPVGFFVTAESWVEPGGTVRVTVSALDRVWNRAAHYRGRVQLELPPGLEVADGPEGPFTGQEAGARVFLLRVVEEGLYHVVARDPDGVLGEGRSNTIFCGEMLNEYRLYWGDLHGHSRLSDGSGSPEDYYSYARDVAGLHVSVLTDHDGHGILPLDQTPGLFEQIRRTTESFNDPGRFITFPGYEWTSWTYGHKHVLFRNPEEAEIFSFRDPDNDEPEELWASLRGKTAMTLSHHVGGGPIACDWDHHDAELERLVEITSIHGVSEYYGGPRSVYRPVEGAFAQDALARGYRLGMIGSGDSHNSHPGTRDVSAATHGLAGIYATGLTRREIWEALHNRRVFATAGQRIVVNFLVNGEMMGGETVVSDPKEPRLIMGLAVGTAEVESVEVLKNNQVMYAERGGGELLKRFAAVDESPAVDGDYYYLRVTQVDGEQAWSSPVWVSLIAAPSSSASD